MTDAVEDVGDPVYTESSGNVFADLELEDAEELRAKSALVHQVVGLVEKRKLTQKAAAALLGTTQPTVSDLVRRRLDRFSMERLFTFLTRLDRDVRIVVSPMPRSRATGRVVVASRGSVAADRAREPAPES